MISFPCQKQTRPISPRKDESNEKKAVTSLFFGAACTDSVGLHHTAYGKCHSFVHQLPDLRRYIYAPFREKHSLLLRV
jgi:hypothetical protein